MIQQETKQREIRKFMIMLSVVNLALFAVTCRGMVRSYNTTMLALSYEYGFTSRSLLGTLYHLLDAVLPLDLIDYRAVVATAYVATILFVLFVEYFLYRCLRCCEGEMVKYGEYLALILSLCLVSTFSFPYNFFRVDIFMILVSLLGVLCLVKERAQWLVVPLSALGVMFHQGYVFMYFNLILVLLFYRALSWWKEDRRKARCYGLLFALSFLVGSVLFLWFEFFSRSNGAAFFDTIKSEAEKLSYDGIYHSTLLYHEVLGIDLASTEEEFSRVNAVQILMCGIVCGALLRGPDQKGEGRFGKMEISGSGAGRRYDPAGFPAEDRLRTLDGCRGGLLCGNCAGPSGHEGSDHGDPGQGVGRATDPAARDSAVDHGGHPAPAVPGREH